eukprot:12235748-Heterocapsa_arctica.AAC.1
MPPWDRRMCGRSRTNYLAAGMGGALERVLRSRRAPSGFTGSGHSPCATAASLKVPRWVGGLALRR